MRGATRASMTWNPGKARASSSGSRSSVTNAAPTTAGQLDGRAARSASPRPAPGAAARAGAKHLVYVSIVGVDDIPLGYYRDKVTIEHMIADSAVPHTIVRATQFREFTATITASLTIGDEVRVPSMKLCLYYRNRTAHLESDR